VDAAHFVHTTFLGYLWCFCRVFIKSPSGRKRFNVLGALNALTLEIITVTNETYINAESVCQLLQKLSDLALGIPITVVWDNARYQKCAAVFELANQLGISLVYLPSYSPHLNLIERLWRFVRKECLYSKYYADFSAFKSAISTLIDTAHINKHEQLKSLMSWKFQSFKKVQFLAE
jgi:transposase